MKEYAKAFYKGKQWQRCKNSFMQSKNYICERCGQPAQIVHHKRYITPNNINDPNITLNWNNLECLCQDCHNKEHMQKHNKILFDDCGNIAGIKDGASIREFKQANKEIDTLLSKIKPNTSH